MSAADPDFVSVAAALSRGKPDQLAVIDPTKNLTRTYAELDAESDAIAHALRVCGVAPGERVALMVPPSIEFFSLTFALLKLSAVPVMIDPGMGIRNVGRCLAEAEPRVMIGIGKAHLARRLFGWARHSLELTVAVGRRWGCSTTYARLLRDGQPRGPFVGPTVTPLSPSAILYTSGSTGIAKGAEYTHGIFAAQVRMLREMYQITPGEIDLCTFPLFALFGPALGMTCVIPKMNPARPATIDPARTLQTMRQFAVTNLFGSPAVVRRLASLNQPLPGVRRVISAGAPASLPLIAQLARLLPEGVQLHTPYGATEALPVTSIGSDELLNETRALSERGAGVCVGRPVLGATVAIIGIDDQPIPLWNDSLRQPPGTIGEIAVSGPMVTACYFRRDAATALAKIIDPATGTLWHRMGDVGYFDDTGRLWFCGRKSHRVVTPDGTLFTDQVEPIFNQVPGVLRSALVGVVRAGRVVPVICIELSSPRRNVRELLIELEAVALTHALTRTIRIFRVHPRFPMDVRHNSKIFREKLAIWADAQVSSTTFAATLQPSTEVPHRGSA